MNVDDFANGKMLCQSVRQESIVVNRVKGQTVELRAEALDRTAALRIEPMGAKFDGDAAECLECVTEQHPFALRVQRRALHALRRRDGARWRGGLGERGNVAALRMRGAAASGCGVVRRDAAAGRDPGGMSRP